MNNYSSWLAARCPCPVFFFFEFKGNVTRFYFISLHCGWLHKVPVSYFSFLDYLPKSPKRFFFFLRCYWLHQVSAIYYCFLDFLPKSSISTKDVIRGAGGPFREAVTRSPIHVSDDVTRRVDNTRTTGRVARSGIVTVLLCSPILF